MKQKSKNIHRPKKNKGHVALVVLSELEAEKAAGIREEDVEAEKAAGIREEELEAEKAAEIREEDVEAEKATGIRRKDFALKEDDRGMGTVEVILIIVVLIGLVIIFKDQITRIVNSLFGKITAQTGGL